MVDILAIGAHPDDVEISMGGAMCVLKKQGYKIGICDLSRGETGTYGSPEIRKKELEAANRILSIDKRITLDLPDGNIQNTEEARVKVIDVIRELRPEIVYSFVTDLTRHPDHAHAGQIVKECVYLAGLEKIKTHFDPFRPSQLIYFPELFINRKPDIVIDITEYFEQKVEAIKAYGSQVISTDKERAEAKTFLRSDNFWDILTTRAKFVGSMVSIKYGEPFYCDLPIRVTDMYRTFIKDKSYK
ncbi:MAG: bacillithiol biosynthesis deacetylase BshB1 [Spirochaetales bacterium]|nr:bacillithiol biosynthesis deacetylase BshB1 [Spirochaetales bacterium]